MLRTDLHLEDIHKDKNKLIDTMFQTIPAGVGIGGKEKLSDAQMEGVLRDGAVWMVENGFGTKDDLLHMEEEGNMYTEDTSYVSQKAKARGRGQLGTLGAGNHFIEIQRVDKIFDKHVAKAFGINSVNQIVVMLHSGSRGLGHQVCTDYLKIHSSSSKKYNIRLPDQQLACAPALPAHLRQVAKVRRISML
jgi:tRNA-splicing ligase RtcB